MEGMRYKKREQGNRKNRKETKRKKKWKKRNDTIEQKGPGKGKVGKRKNKAREAAVVRRE